MLKKILSVVGDYAAAAAVALAVGILGLFVVSVGIRHPHDMLYVSGIVLLIVEIISILARSNGYLRERQRAEMIRLGELMRRNPRMTDQDVAIAVENLLKVSVREPLGVVLMRDADRLTMRIVSKAAELQQRVLLLTMRSLDTH